MLKSFLQFSLELFLLITILVKIILHISLAHSLQQMNINIYVKNLSDRCLNSIFAAILRYMISYF